jgi:hypothetical protein
MEGRRVCDMEEFDNSGDGVHAELAELRFCQDRGQFCQLRLEMRAAELGMR